MDLTFAKVDEERRLVFGFFNINKIGNEIIKDRQGHCISTNELEDAVYRFVLEARVMGEDHERKGVGHLVESVMLTYEKQNAIGKALNALGIEATVDLGCEGWFGGFYVEDDQTWESIVRGDRPSFSIAGSGHHVSVEEEG